ncbi:MAG: glycosyltransferase [Sandarakinorhabdus sp.]|nr:glycosyltransferase [Sandarakinorhabdus sp.]
MTAPAATPQAPAQAPRISIVTLSFNQARFLDAAITSITGQGYPNLDYIVVDPGSTDGSRAIIDAHRDRITTVLLDPDKGPADGLNKGFAAATGDIFGYINADDLLLPGALAAVARHFTENPQVDGILGNGILIDDNGDTRRPMKSSRFSLTDLGHGAMTFVQQGHFFRRSAFAASGGFNIANRTCWDGELLVDMALAGARFINVPDQLGAFRLYGDTITGSGRLAEAMKIDTARYQAKALGRPPQPIDRLVAPLRLLARRIADPPATIDGLRARLARD